MVRSAYVSGVPDGSFNLSQQSKSAKQPCKSPTPRNDAALQQVNYKPDSLPNLKGCSRSQVIEGIFDLHHML